MTYKVIKSFRDKTGKKKLYKKGSFYEHEDPKRIEFLIEKGFIAEESQEPINEKTKKSLFKKNQ